MLAGIAIQSRPPSLDGSGEITVSAQRRIVSLPVSNAQSEKVSAIFGGDLGLLFEGADGRLQILLAAPQHQALGRRLLLRPGRRRAGFGGGVVGGFKEGIEFALIGVLKPNDTVLVDQQSAGDALALQQVERIEQDWPFHLMPLHEQTGPLGMLFLGNSEDLELTGFFQFGCLGVPPGHVFAATRSPRCENVQHHFLATEIVQRKRLLTVNGGEHDRWKHLAAAPIRRLKAGRCHCHHRHCQ